MLQRFSPLLLLLCASPTLAGEPYLVKDISPAFASGGSRPEGFYSLGNAAVFVKDIGPPASGRTSSI